MKGKEEEMRTARTRSLVAAALVCALAVATTLARAADAERIFSFEKK